MKMDPRLSSIKMGSQQNLLGMRRGSERRLLLNMKDEKKNLDKE